MNLKSEKLNTIVLKLECLVSEQWQQQISSFQAGQPGDAAGNDSLGQSIYMYVRLYRSTYIADKSVYIVYVGTSIYFISKLYTVINNHTSIPEYTVIYNILVYTIYNLVENIYSYRVYTSI